MKKLIALAFVAAASVMSANAAVTITWNAAFQGGMSSNLANTAGTVSNGLFYGIIALGADGAYLPEYNQALTLTAGAVIPLTGSDDVIYLANDLTADSSQGNLQLSEGDFTTLGGNGGVTGISFTASNGILANQKYGIIWFDTTTNKAGVFTDASFVIPSDGQIVSHDSAWTGVDPVRSATNIQFAPEVSSTLLGLLGMVGLLRRRR